MITFYKLYNLIDPTKLIYIGSTTKYEKRKINHKSRYNNINDDQYNTYLYKYIRDNGGYDVWGYEILRIVNYDITKSERLNIEHNYIMLNNNTINKNMPGAIIRVGLLQYQYMRRDTNNICDKCGTMYRGMHNKIVHQKTNKCKSNARIINL